MRRNRFSSPVSNFGWIATTILTCLLVETLPPTVADASGPTFTLLDVDDQPIPNALVRQFGESGIRREEKQYKLRHQTTTNDSGQFQLPDGVLIANPYLKRIEGGPGLVATWVTVPSVGNEHERTWLLGTSAGIPDAYFQWNLRSVAMFYGKAIEMPDREDLEKDLVIRLPKPSTDLRIISAEGAPQPNVTITPTQLVWFARELTPDDNNDHGAIRKRIGVPPVLRASLARTTDADGRVSFSTRAIAPHWVICDSE